MLENEALQHGLIIGERQVTGATDYLEVSCMQERLAWFKRK